MLFSEFFEIATGHAPYPYQARVARDGLPDVLEAPTGTGKTEAVVVPWLWWSFRGSPDVRATTPRRLVIALPLRTLVEQTEDRIRAMLNASGLTDRVLVRALMGGRMTRDAMAEWRTNPERHSIVVGTIDSVVSRALNRGYGQSRATYPIDFALVTNGAHLVVDEVQLGVQATATLRQVGAFQRSWNTAEPVGLTCVSATVLPQALDTVDNPFDAHTATVVDLTEEDEHDASLARRLGASKVIRRLEECSTPKDLATRVTENHVAGTLTLVMVNTVKQAVATFRALQRTAPAPTLLVHSHFRGVERAATIQEILSPLPEAGRIVVSTQSLEAGVDLDARTLITEVAPWSSLVQRAGRCNRTGDQDGAVLFWTDEGTRGPYEPADIAATTAALESLEELRVTGRDLQSMGVRQTPTNLTIIRRADMLDLFETSADQAGRDIDISPFIRGDESLDVQVAWVTAAEYVGGSPPPVPGERWRCSVSMKSLRDFVARKHQPRVYVFDTFADRWVRARPDRIRPQQLLLIEASDGGYDPKLGFSAAAQDTVSTDRDEGADTGPDLVSDGMGAETAAQTGEWVTLPTHLQDAREVAESLCTAIESTVPLTPDVSATVAGAAALHDWGKSHEIWQRAIRSTAEPPPGDAPWAKSASHGRLSFSDSEGRNRPNFRHELVSALMLSTPAGERVMARAGVPEDQFDLCRYLVAAHHGHIRISPQDPSTEGTSGGLLLGVADGDSLPTFEDAAQANEPTVVDLTSMFGGGPGSWTARTLRLLDTWGPFRLAYAEMLVRMADWRASARSHQQETP